ncbi:MAG: ATP-binding cassette domain-containing protein [Desulfobacteraceae bacterium]|nr:ATP-binding cassette domain-containing protein [Desulfobacteraceae bacterium]
MSIDTTPVLLEVAGLKKYFPVKHGTFGRHHHQLKAVDGVSFGIRSGETFGLVGESGCGKSTCARTIIRLYRPTAGRIIFEGQDIAPLNSSELMPVRRKIQMIFQDPFASLNARMTVQDIISEPLDIHNIGTPAERRDRVDGLLRRVGLDAAHAGRYPHEFSGGQRQRIGIARAIAINPSLIICDEPISALDVSIQAQVVNMLEDLQADLGLTYLFIAHDLSMVKHISDKMGVMYLGRMVEMADSREIYANPLHPYTQMLLSAIPIPDPKKARARTPVPMDREIPSPLDLPMGCRFVDRCRQSLAICREIEPGLCDTGAGHWAACHLYR